MHERPRVEKKEPTVFELKPFNKLTPGQELALASFLPSIKREVTHPRIRSPQVTVALLADGIPIGAISYAPNFQTITRLAVNTKNPRAKEFHKFAGYSASEELIRHAVKGFRGYIFSSLVPISQVKKRWIRRTASRLGLKPTLEFFESTPIFMHFKIPRGSKAGLKPKLSLKK
ncbi:hypothetical protein HY991_02975 [Candidatus Micrarchaeota archaeon]|nr:hypothetical protein [Candidatus Micrarchaeota archaeon]